MVKISFIKTQKTSNITIASHESVNPGQADYVCTGNNDESVINIAVRKLAQKLSTDVLGVDEYTNKNGGGKITFLDGTFDISHPIQIEGIDNITLEGQGNSTILNNTNTDGEHCIESINEPGTTNPWKSGQNRITIKNLLIQGNDLSGDGIHFEETVYETIHNVFSQGNGGYGLYIKALTTKGGAGNKIITDSQFMFNGESGLYLENTHETLITSCHFEENDNAGIEYKNATNIILTGCSIEDNYGTYQLTGTGAYYPQISNTVIEGNAYLGLAENTSLQIDNVGVSRLDIIGGTGSNAYISNSIISGLGDVTASRVHISNSQLTSGENTTVTVVRLLINNSRWFWKTTAEHIISDEFILESCSIENSASSDTLTLNPPDISGTRFIITGCSLYKGTILINGRSGQNQSIQLSDNIIRLSQGTITINNTHTKINDNIIRGTGTVTVNASETLSINSNTLLSLTNGPLAIVIGSDCSALSLFSQNIIKEVAVFTLTDNSGNLIKNGNIGVEDG